MEAGENWCKIGINLGKILLKQKNSIYMEKLIAICAFILLLLPYSSICLPEIPKNNIDIAMEYKKLKNESWSKNLQEKSKKISVSSFSPGSYAKAKLNEPVSPVIMENDAIVGILLDASWRNLEPQEGVYNWDLLDKRIEEAVAYGKKISLNVMAGGVNTPQWLFDNYDIQTFTFIDTNKYHKSYLQNVTIPVFWDPIFLEKKMDFIKALGKRYSNNSNIVAVMVSFANAMTNDWNIPHFIGKIAGREINQVRDWLNMGYTYEKMLYAGMLTIDTWAESFPNQCLKLPIGITHEELDGSKTKLAEDIVKYAYENYPDRFFIQVNALCPMLPTANNVTNAQPGEPFYLLKLLAEHSPQIGLQMLAAASNGYKDGFRLNGGEFGFPREVLLGAVEVGLSYNPCYIEYWKEDAVNRRLLPVMKYATNAMKNGIAAYINKPRGLCIFDKQIFPANIAIVVGKVNVEARVYSKNMIDRVEFYVNDELKFIDNGEPYQWLWNEKTIGWHEIKVIIYGMEGNETEDEISVIIFHLGRK